MLGKLVVIFSVFSIACISCSREQKCRSVCGKVIICGVCKDVERAIPVSIDNVEKLGALFDDYKVLIYENNSGDRTPELLKVWAKENDRVSITSEVIDDNVLSEACFNKTIQDEFYRPERIARARNIVLTQAMQPELDDFAYVIWLDLDFEHPLPLQEIVKTFYSVQEWDAVFANGVNDAGHFYDSYSLRDALLPVGAELIGDQWWRMRGEICLAFRPEDSWYPVLSAFGGMGIYKREAIKGCHYSATVTKDLETFQKRLICDEKWKVHPEIQEYFQGIQECATISHLPALPIKNMPWYKHNGRDEGFVIGEQEEGIIYRMNSGVCQYPSICEHVPFHATMILNGYDKLFVNPALVLYYFGRT